MVVHGEYGGPWRVHGESMVVHGEPIMESPRVRGPVPLRCFRRVQKEDK